MAERRVRSIKGNKDFLVLAIFFFVIGIWAVIDAWFPPQGVLKKHPRSVEVKTLHSGTIKELHINVGDTVLPTKDDNQGTLIAELKNASLEKQLEKAKKKYNELRNMKDRSEEQTKDFQQASEHISTLLNKIDEHKIFTPKLGKEKNGTISKLLVNKYDYVEEGQSIAIITPNRQFYIFNISLAIFCCFAFIGFMYMHIAHS